MANETTCFYQYRLTIRKVFGIAHKALPLSITSLYVEAAVCISVVLVSNYANNGLMLVLK